MTKQELAKEMADKADIDQGTAKEALEAALATISAELSRGGEVSLAGFGKFSVSERSAREGRNPATGETIQIQASKAPKFSAASALKKELNS